MAKGWVEKCVEDATPWLLRTGHSLCQFFKKIYKKHEVSFVFGLPKRLNILRHQDVTARLVYAPAEPVVALEPRITHMPPLPN